MFRIAAAARRLASTPSLRLFHGSVNIQAPLTTRFHLPDPASPDEHSSTTRKFSPKLTKIVATIGPTSEQLPVLQEVVKNGMRIMRLNFSHATTEEVELRMGNLTKCRVSKNEQQQPLAMDYMILSYGCILDIVHCTLPKMTRH